MIWSQHFGKLQSSEVAAYMYLKNIWNRTHRLKYNFAEANVGDTGSGKTVSTITKSYLLNKKRFDERSYCNSAKDFIQAIDDSKKGDALIWDECGVSLSSRKWNTIPNILIGETLQTYRHNKLCVFFVLPDLSFIDVQARKLMNAFVETKRYTTTESINWTYKLIINRRTGDIYFPHFRTSIRGEVVNIPRIHLAKNIVDKVPKKIMKAITNKEIEFKSKLRKKNLSLISLIEKETFQTEETIFDLINKIIENKEKYTNDKGKLDSNLIQLEENLSRDKASQILKFIKKKDSQPSREDLGNK